ncbi:ABC transporter substrate-binding protein [Natronosalvus halobius]|uniref:ABC transporter substrate-binding protein n=1 Tax=Natronosalvus halobius TaxID=2953746 RepID=UPI0020A13F9F|nr:ABC transporter substrate-binding protein [Natronosalvus halobius]USZ72942.1 ABC transporter substrate-binding protein [Natronosalvus halobius]
MDNRVRRRDVLATLGAAASASLAGCSEYIWSGTNGTSPDPISLEIKTVPTDDDVIAPKIANQLTDNLRTVGIDTDHVPLEEAELYREVLIERNYDIFIVRHPGIDEVDSLRSLLHSDFVGEQGWQNPFRFSDPTADNHLDSQREADGDERREIFDSLFTYLTQDDTAPYTVVAHHDHLGAVDADLSLSRIPFTPREYLEAVTNPPDDEIDRPLRAGLFGYQRTSRLNPLVVDLTDVQTILDLVYDPLVRKFEEEYVHWLANGIEWEESSGALEATVTLHDGLHWHDSEPIDAEDVRFTVDFLSDTSLGEAESPVTAPQLRGRQSLIDEVTVVGERTARIRFDDVSREVARWALTLPLLPEHVWYERSELVGDHQTAALNWDNSEPIGSGLFAFVESEDGESVTLELFEDHVLYEPESESESEDEDEDEDEPATDDPETEPESDGGTTNGTDDELEDEMDDELEDGDEDDQFDDEDASTEADAKFDGLEFRVLPNAGAALDALIDGDLDFIANQIPATRLDEVQDEESIRTTTQDTGAFYMIGYNLTHSSLGNPRFRGVISQLIDRENAVEAIFHGYARAPEAQSAFVGIPADQWDTDRYASGYAFPGQDGELDEEQARALFEEAGYNYVNGELVE